MYLNRISCQSLLLRIPLVVTTHLARPKSSGKHIKELNYANKALFGSVQARTDDDAEPKQTTQPIVKTMASKHDCSSEIYWLMQHKQAAKPATAKKRSPSTAPTSAKKPSKPRVRKAVFAPDEDILAAQSTPKTRKRSKRVSDRPADIVPTSLTRFSDTLCKPPIKSLAALVAPKRTRKNSETLSETLRQMQLIPAFALDGFTVTAAIVGDKQCDVLGCDERLDIGQMPSVGKVLQATMPAASRQALVRWKQLKVAELGEAGFAEMQQAHLTTGTQFHAALQDYFQTQKTPPTHSPLRQLWFSVSSVLPNIDGKPQLIEAPVVHPILQYKGIVDCVSTVNGDLSVIEWKKSDRLKSSVTATFDAPLQLCAYLGAINADPRYRLHIRNGLVVIAYSTGAPAHSFRLSESAVRQYWNAWLERLHEYWMRRRDGTLPEPI